MENLPEFIANNTLLVLAWAGTLAFLLWNLLGESVQGIQRLTPLEAVQKINHDGAIVVDVRESSEFEGGHILDSLHIPLGTLGNNLKRLEKYREKAVIVSCASGNRSASACHTLKKNGFAQVYNLRGGVYAWQNANLPLSRGNEKKKNKTKQKGQELASK